MPEPNPLQAVPKSYPDPAVWFRKLGSQGCFLVQAEVPDWTYIHTANEQGQPALAQGTHKQSLLHIRRTGKTVITRHGEGLWWQRLVESIFSAVLAVQSVGG
ncbi:hypothetical protein VFPPC_15534 [Pochonia chlamydosporia 170]|uniref:Uncharacterized protein n=1 Tax=Pochonia chlamydosporia 170 TaxID=1380566 RepID=A0A179FWR6_METCM|nr:hypothetical protein VFPPC_15534 [Pochonia chlamydosporia 170]OAQ70105.1 hypothetical protein VFPPC_15534 [Pochonia chlamydosporia 170]